MPISVVSFLVKANPLTLPFIIQDVDLRGGFRVVDNMAARDTMHPGAKKPHMLVLTADDGVIWKLDGAGTTWETWQAPGNNSGLGLDILSTEQPLFVDATGQLRVRPERILPPDGLTGQVPVMQSDGSILWEDQSATASPGVRTTVNKTDFAQLEPGAGFDFDLPMALTSMVLDLTLNAPDLRIEAYSTPTRDELNPYTFKSMEQLLSDVGISELAGNQLIQYNRRYALLANREVPPVPMIYWKIINESALPLIPTLSLTYLVLE